MIWNYFEFLNFRTDRNLKIWKTKRKRKKKIVIRPRSPCNSKAKTTPDYLFFIITCDIYLSARPLLWDIAVAKVKAKEAKLEGNDQLETDKNLLILGARGSVSSVDGKMLNPI
jgi:hypothetical protein